MKTKSKSSKASTRNPTKPAQARPEAAESPAENHVPEGAEDFEHTLKRLVIEKEKQRSKAFGMYLRA